jgi:hypothetical protein
MRKYARPIVVFGGSFNPFPAAGPSVPAPPGWRG